MIGDAQLIAALRGYVHIHTCLLQEVLEVLDSGRDFQLGPKGKHAGLRERIREALGGDDLTCKKCGTRGVMGTHAGERVCYACFREAGK